MVSTERVGGDQDESGTSIDDTSGRAEDVGSTEVNALVDTPEFVSRRGTGDRSESDGTSELGGVGSAESELSVTG